MAAMPVDISWQVLRQIVHEWAGASAELAEVKPLEGCDADAFDQVQAELAEIVLRMHSNSSSHYHRLTHEEPKRYDAWAPCYRDIYDGIWHEVEKLPAPLA